MDALEQLNLAAAITDTYTAVEAAIIRHIAEQLAANPDTLINSASEWRIQMLARMGRLTKETGKLIASKVGKVPDEVEAAINTAVSSVLKQHNLEITDKLSGNIGKALESYNRQAVKDKYNQVNTVMQYKAKQSYVNGVNSVADRFARIQQKALENSQEYLDVLNKNAMAVTLGESSRTQALRETITEMSEKGIPAFVDASGREWSPEAYVNMDIRNTVKNAALAAEFASLDELGQDVILVSSHAGARKKCYPYQGKFFSRSGKTGTIKDGNGKEYTYSPLSDTSFGEPDGLFGINCGHRMRGVSDGLFIYREKQYDEKENSEEYEKVCKQRQMERNIRKDRRTRDALEAAGDTEGAKELQRKIAEENKQLKEYCHREGIVYRQDRTRTYGYSDESRKKKPVDLVESVDKSAESDIIKLESEDDIEYYNRLNKLEQELKSEQEKTDEKLISFENDIWDKYGEPEQWPDHIEKQYSKMSELIESIGVKIESVVQKKSEAEIKAVHQLSDKIKEIGGFNSVNINGCNFKSAESIYNSIDMCFKTVPQLKGKIGYLELKRIDDLRDHAYTTIIVGEKLSVSGITLNKSLFADIENSGLLEKLNKDILKNHHPVETGSPLGVISHEFGHAIDVLLRNNGNAMYGSNKSKLLKQVGWDDTKENKNDFIVRNLSSYAIEEHEKEFISEAWSEYLCNPNPRPLAKAVGDWVMSELEKTI